MQNPGNARFNVGDEVTLELTPQSLLRAALIVYGIPLAVIVAAAGLAMLLGWSDLTSTLAMLAAGVVGISVGRRRLRRTNCLMQFVPVIQGPASNTH